MLTHFLLNRGEVLHGIGVWVFKIVREETSLNSAYELQLLLAMVVVRTIAVSSEERGSDNLPEVERVAGVYVGQSCPTLGNLDTVEETL